MWIAFALGVWLILTIVSSLFSTRVFLCSYLVYFLLVPFMDLHFIGIPLGYNGICFICLLVFLVKNKFTWKQLDFTPIKPFLFLYALLLLMIPFQNQGDMPVHEMFNYWRASLMSTMIVPFMIWNWCKRDPGAVKGICITMLACIGIICGYGLFLTTIPGVNPYLMLTLPINGQEFNTAYALGGSGEMLVVSGLMGGRVFGRISSVFPQPMVFGLFAALSVLYLIRNRRYCNRITFVLLMGISIISVFVCGVRTAIICLGIAIVVYLLLQRSVKVTILTVILCYIVYQIIMSIPGMQLYVGSLIGLTNGSEEIVGSSFDMRHRQFLGVMDIIKNCSLQGRGYGWTTWYLENHISHPVCLYFESIIMSVLCNNGIIGMVIWIVVIFMYLFGYRYADKTRKSLSIALLLSYFGFACVTGEYGEIKYFLLMFTLINLDSGDEKKALSLDN